MKHFITFRHWILLLAVVLAMPAVSCRADDKQALQIKLTDGTSRWFRFAYSPVVTFTDDGLTISSTKHNTSFAFADVAEFRFSDIPTDITSTRQSEPSFVYVSDESIIVRDASSSDIDLYDLSGRKLPSDQQQRSDGVSVSLRSLPAGVYIIRIKNQSIKVTKR